MSSPFLPKKKRRRRRRRRRRRSLQLKDDVVSYSPA